ncbi:hypothetical protein ABL78_0795 [Leptomonas seymouri]|uniref:Uncharacterized protein n=1 Tax=Leptomonas seymouri TaxID=5684 RepID=A0A0N1I8D0_LEPSE|nr:hypothetical protein ABL78_0795 [Leptomonas seymouri]|eukprot:KPI90150.1 hypothetical protein ABL78_0795 [Leptomonas seymouri]
MDAKSTVLSKEPTTLRNTRMQDTFADVLSRDWPFESLPTDTEALTAAVRVGQESALIHYANSGFKDMSSRLAREASAVGMETDRYRLAAQYSSMQCKDALRAYKHAQAELAAAQQEVRTLISKEEQADALQSRLASPDSSIDALATQLDQELAQMRTQKQRYELLCSQKSQLEAKVDDWTAKEKNLETKLDRVQVRCAKECEDALRGIHAKRALSGECTLEGQTKSAKACLRDFDVCIMERLELLRHLQRGAADRIEKLKTFLNHTREHHPHGCGEGKGSPREEAHEVSAAQTAAEGDTAHGCEREGSSRKTVDGETPEGDTSMQLLDYLAKVQQTVALGEEEALTEMEHLRVQLRRLQRQEDS